MQLIWWDADAEGQDEQGTFGRGMMRSADGGRRYLPGELPAGPPNVFDDEGSVLLNQQLPADQAPSSYPSPGPGG